MQSEESLSDPKSHSNDLQSEHRGSSFTDSSANQINIYTTTLEKIIREEGMLKAVEYYKAMTGKDLHTSMKEVESFKDTHGIQPYKGKSGCAGMLVVLLILPSLLFFASKLLL